MTGPTLTLLPEDVERGGEGAAVTGEADGDSVTAGLGFGDTVGTDDGAALGVSTSFGSKPSTEVVPPSQPPPTATKDPSALTSKNSHLQGVSSDHRISRDILRVRVKFQNNALCQ